MLVLSRRTGEKIVVNLPGGDTLVFSVVKMTGNKVTVGIVAPDNVTIYRSELLDKPGFSPPAPPAA